MGDESARLPPGKLDARLLEGLLGQLPGGPELLVGPGVGRDVAVIDTGEARYWLLKSDPVTFATDEIGHYAVTVNANDIATAGGRPRWFLATLLLPEVGTTPGLVERIFGQLRDACGRYGVLLVGGHTEITLGLDRPLVAGTMVGEVAREELVRSDGVEPGDAILCTKGVPLEGCAILAREKDAELRAAGFDRAHLERCARYLHDPGISVLADARAACGAVRVHAMHDPTEGGLATALWELAEASGVGLRIDAAAIPIPPPARALCAHLGLDPLGVISSGALLVAVAPRDAAAVVEACRGQGIDCTQIGSAVPSEQGVRLVRGSRESPLPRFDQDEIGRALG